MSLLQSITKGKTPKPPRIIIYGTEGVGKSNLELAERVGRNESYVARILRLATVSPAIVRAVIAGDFNLMLSLTKLCKSMPVTWEEQEKMYLGK